MRHSSAALARGAMRYIGGALAILVGVVHGAMPLFLMVDYGTFVPLAVIPAALGIAVIVLGALVFVRVNRRAGLTLLALGSGWVALILMSAYPSLLSGNFPLWRFLWGFLLGPAWLLLAGILAYLGSRQTVGPALERRS